MIVSARLEIACSRPCAPPRMHGKGFIIAPTVQCGSTLFAIFSGGPHTVFSLERKVTGRYARE
jgi:hypothetical protein